MRPSDAAIELLKACATGNVKLFELFRSVGINLDSPLPMNSQVLLHDANTCRSETIDNPPQAKEKFLEIYAKEFPFLNKCSSDFFEILGSLGWYMEGRDDPHPFYGQLGFNVSTILQLQ